VSRFLLVSMLVVGALGTLESQAALPREAEIHDLVRRYVEAREKRDPKAIEALFTADADQLVSTGEWRRGRDAVVKGTLASSAATGGSRSITVETVRLIGTDLAIADGRYEISQLAGGETRRMWTTFVMVRQNGTWRIQAIRNMLPSPAAPPATVK
jgi:uncharacterized protein (TIGR02246 family)